MERLQQRATRQRPGVLKCVHINGHVMGTFGIAMVVPARKSCTPHTITWHTAPTPPSVRPMRGAHLLEVTDMAYDQREHPCLVTTLWEFPWYVFCPSTFWVHPLLFLFFIYFLLNRVHYCWPCASISFKSSFFRKRSVWGSNLWERVKGAKPIGQRKEMI